MSFPLLQVENLSVAFRMDGCETVPVRSVSLSVAPGERVALVGESGCGKSLTAMALTRLSPTDRARCGGSVIFDGVDVMRMRPRQISGLRGRGIAYVFQDPSASLNPVMRVSDQIKECLHDMNRKQKDVAVLRLLAQTGLPDVARAARAYPCELSGGQQQRVMLAMALAARPKLLVADEPTTALDVTTQRQVLDLLEGLAEANDMAVLLITHNLGIVAGCASRVYVMYAGEVVETGGVSEVLARPAHPYTRGLLASVPMLDTPRDAPLKDIPGTVPSADCWPAGCAFAPRCARAMPRCGREPPPERATDGRMYRCWLAPADTEKPKPNENRCRIQ